MKTKYARLFQVLFILVFLLGSYTPQTVLAQDETPVPTEPVAVVEVVTPEPDTAIEAPVTEVPATEVVPVAPTELPVVPTEIMPAPQVVEVSEAVNTLAAEDLVLIDENGNPLPLASQQAEEALSSDPLFWDGSQWVGYVKNGSTCPAGIALANCHKVSNPFQAAVSAAPANTTIYVAGYAVAATSSTNYNTYDGYYNEDVTIGGNNLSFMGFSDIILGITSIPTSITTGYAYVKSFTLQNPFGSTTNVFGNEINLTSENIGLLTDALSLLNPVNADASVNIVCPDNNDIYVLGSCHDGNEKMYLCHYDGLAGSEKFQELYIPVSAIFSNANGVGGHLNIDGSPSAGHEDDTLGRCPVNTATPTATATDEPTATPTATEEPTATATEEPTATATEEPTATATATEEPTATATEEPTATATVEPTATATEEPTATATATDEPTATTTEEPTATATEEPTATPTVTSTPTETATPTAIATTIAVIPPVIPVTGGTPAALVIPVTGGQLIPVTGGTLIVSGLGHSCMTYNNGQVICWGLNSSGQVGDGSFKEQHKPVYVKDLSGVLNLTAGSKHTCALTISGEVWCWGENSSGQLGDGTTTNSNIPVKVVDLPGKVLSFTAGNEFTCAQMMNQEVWCWGKNDFGQLNDGSTQNQLVPVKSKLNTMLAQISGGQDLLLGSDVLGTVNEWAKVQAAAVQQLAGSLSISANRWGDTGCAVASDGSVKCWGSNLISAPVKDALPALEVGAGLAHNCNINTNESVSCWGVNSNGQLGNGSNTDSLSATLVKNLTKAHALAVGANHTCILSGASNIAWCWGENNFGQLGNNSTTNSNIPVLVIMPTIQ